MAIVLYVLYVNPFSTTCGEHLLKLYLKPSFSVFELREVLDSPGTAVLLKDVLRKKIQGIFLRVLHLYWLTAWLSTLYL